MIWPRRASEKLATFSRVGDVLAREQITKQTNVHDTRLANANCFLVHIFSKPVRVGKLTWRAGPSKTNE